MKPRLIKSVIISLVIAALVTAVPLGIYINSRINDGASFSNWFSKNTDEEFDSSVRNCGAVDFKNAKSGDILAYNICLKNEPLVYDSSSNTLPFWYFILIFIYVFLASAITCFGILSIISKLPPKKNKK